jgi:hypothetical protein
MAFEMILSVRLSKGDMVEIQCHSSSRGDSAQRKIKLPSHTEKVRRQGIMMKDTAMVLLCYDMTRRRKDRVILELSIPKPGGHVLSPEFDQVRRWAAIKMGLKIIH